MEIDLTTFMNTLHHLAGLYRPDKLIAGVPVTVCRYNSKLTLDRFIVHVQEPGIDLIYVDPTTKKENSNG